MDILEKLQQICEVEENKELAPLTTFKIGGPARFFCVAKSAEEISALIKICQKNNLPYYILGGGSNVLFSDDGFDGLVVKINNQQLAISNNSIKCDAGVSLNKLVGESVAAGLTGLEWATGIPGTVGGAIYGNAGAYGSDISESIQTIKVLENGKVKDLSNQECSFSYRSSIFKDKKNKGVILSVILKLKKGNIKSAKARQQEINSQRNDKFMGGACAGSFFKNVFLDKSEMEKFKNYFPYLPDDFVKWGKVPAAWLIDQAGLKGQSVGDAQVSEKHAGIILNTGQATAKDIMALAKLVKKQIKNKFHINLTEEVEIIK